MAKELTGSRVGAWTLQKYLGAGKSALVFEGRNDKLLGAVKIFDPEIVERFGRKTQEERINRELLLRGKSHPNLVGIIDGGSCPASNHLYVVMELIRDAPNLAESMADVPRDRIGHLICQVAGAARFLESEGIVHRDIKPDNIVVQNNFERAVLLDLGVILPFGSTPLTDGESLHFLGTLQYSSPEYLFRTEKSDVDGWRALTFYQLGAVLHDLIMRKRIFQEFTEPYARLVEAVKYEIPKVDAADVAPELVLLARNCLLKDPVQRLKYVQWEHFEPANTNVSGLAAAKDRLRRRRALANERSATESKSSPSQRDRSLRRKVDEIQGQLQNMIKQECVGNDAFPPLEVHEFQDREAHRAQFAIFFGHSLEHGLSSTLVIVLSVTLVDLESTTIELSMAAALANTDAPRTLPQKIDAVRIYAGAFEENSVRTAILERIYSAMEGAQEFSEKRSMEAKVVSLPLKQLPQRRDNA